MKPHDSISAAPAIRLPRPRKTVAAIALLVVVLGAVDAAAQGLLRADTDIGGELAYAVALDGQHVAAGAPGDFSRSGSAHTYECVGQRCSSPVALMPFDLAPGDLFGAAVSLSADTLAVAAPGQAGGAVYVYVHDGLGWLLQQKLGATPALPGERFGEALALEGSRLAIGAPGAEDGAGALYVFERNAGLWAQTDRLQASDASAGDALGTSVALSADTVLAGAPQWTNAQAGSFSRGAVYVFHYVAPNWLQQASLQPLAAANGDRFGRSLDLAADRAVIGAPLADAGIGSAFVFERSGPFWIQRARLAAPAGIVGDRFGWSVALDGGELLIGAPFALGGCGGATRFLFNGTDWQAAPGPALAQTVPAGLVGWSVAAQAQRRLVGVPGYSGAPSHVGAGYWRDAADAIFNEGFDDVGAAACIVAG